MIYKRLIISESSVLRTVGFGGNANDGSNAGLVYLNSNNAPSDANANYGSRQYFIIKNIKK